MLALGVAQMVMPEGRWPNESHRGGVLSLPILERPGERQEQALAPFSPGDNQGTGSVTCGGVDVRICPWVAVQGPAQVG